MDKKVTFATSCYENDWQEILSDNYLKDIIFNHDFAFFEKILIINNVTEKNLNQVIAKAEEKIKAGIITKYYLAKDYIEKILTHFCLERESFKVDPMQGYDIDDDWIFFNALAPLCAIYVAKSDFLLYQTGDVYLDEKISWIDKALKKLEKRKIFVANLLWNYKSDEAKKESYKKDKDFFYSKDGFSDQQFLVKVHNFKRPIYNEIRNDRLFPRGDVFEKRVYSFMKNHKLKRITYRRGSYIHN